MTFSLYPFRFHFEAQDTIVFSPGLAGNTIRGALGTIFQKLACKPDCPGARTCEHRGQCAYARLFEPTALQATPSGLRDQPRPFVIRAASLDGTRVAPGHLFHFDVIVFDIRDPGLPHFIASFEQLLSAGLGPRRGKAKLIAVDEFVGQAFQPAAGLLAGGAVVDAGGRAEARLQPGRAAPLTLHLDAMTPASRVEVHYLTPTELKAEGAIVDRPEFGVLFARVRDRVSALRSLYGDGPVEIDFRAMGESAAKVRMTWCDLRWEHAERRSSKTGQRHALGGFTGVASYEGDLGEFLPWLRAAEWTGVGRQTVWGKGAIRVESSG